MHKLESINRWIRETIPLAIAAGISIYNWMLIRLRREEKAHDKTKLEKELVENELEVERDFNGRSSSDVINDVVRAKDRPK